MWFETKRKVFYMKRVLYPLGQYMLTKPISNVGLVVNHDSIPQQIKIINILTSTPA